MTSVTIAESALTTPLPAHGCRVGSRCRWALSVGAMTLALGSCKFPYPPDVGFEADDLVQDAALDGPMGPTFARAYASGGEDFGQFVSASDRSLVVGGLGAQGVDLGGGLLHDPFFVAMLDPAGGHVWSLGLRSPVADAVYDRFGNVYVVGELDGMVDLTSVGGPVLTSDGPDLLVAKFDPTGRLLWSRSIGGSGAQRGQRAVVSSDDDIVICGEFAGPTTFGGAPLSARGNWDIFAAKLRVQTARIDGPWVSADLVKRVAEESRQGLTVVRQRLVHFLAA